MKPSIWDRGLDRPKRGPLRWLELYLLVMGAATFGVWYLLSFVSPTSPDPMTGHTHLVLFRRSDYYVTASMARVLSIGVWHSAALGFWFAFFFLMKAGARPESNEKTE